MTRRHWVKLWTEDTLFGSTFKELEPDERAVWFGLLCLAGDSMMPGVICVAPNIPYTDDQLAKILNVPLELFKRATTKMLSPEVGKLKQNGSGCLEVVNWSRYQPDWNRIKNYPSQQSNNTIPPPGIVGNLQPTSSVGNLQAPPSVGNLQATPGVGNLQQNLQAEEDRDPDRARDNARDRARDQDLDLDPRDLDLYSRDLDLDSRDRTGGEEEREGDREEEGVIGGEEGEEEGGEEEGSEHMFSSRTSTPRTGGGVVHANTVGLNGLSACLRLPAQAGRSGQACLTDGNGDCMMHSVDDLARKLLSWKGWIDALPAGRDAASETAALLQELQIQFPQLDLAAEVAKFVDWWDAGGQTGRKTLRRGKVALRNWCEVATRIQAGRPNGETHFTEVRDSAFWEKYAAAREAKEHLRAH